MADQATASIVVDAAPDAVFAVVVDVARYPEWVGFVRTVEVLSHDGAGRPERARFVVDAGLVKADYTVVYTYDGTTRMSWTLESGSIKENAGSYALSDRGDGTTEVTYSLSVDAGIPLLGMFKRKAEEAIMDAALRGLKQRVSSR